MAVAAAQAASKTSFFSRWLAKPLMYGLYGFGFAHMIGEHIGCFVLCQGDSMVPTLRDGDLLWSRRCHFLGGPQADGCWGLREGDIVCLINPLDPSGCVMKRIHKFRQKDRLSAPVEVEVRGDNTAISIDSREYGPVPLGLVKYRAVCRILPWNQRGWLS